MANISTYPIGTPAAGDLIPGTQQATDASGKTVNLTRNFSVSAISSFATNNYVEVTTSIANSQWLALGGTQIILVPNPGANKYIKVLEASIFFDHAGNNFAFTNLEIAPAGGNSQAVLTAAVASPVTEDQVWTLATTNSLMSSAALVFRNVGVANPTGAGTVEVKVRYQVLDTLAF